MCSFLVGSSRLATFSLLFLYPSVKISILVFVFLFLMPACSLALPPTWYSIQERGPCTPMGSTAELAKVEGVGKHALKV